MPTELIDISAVIEDLADDIEAGKCTLLLGPEVLTFDGKSLRRFVHQQLLDRFPDLVLYYYDREGLFLFKDMESKIKAAREIKRIYRHLEYDDSMYRTMLEIPLPLIISLNEDLFLSQAARDYRLLHHFRYFRFRLNNKDRIKEMTPEPTVDCPLLYNLLGCETEDESLVLDYTDLFGFMREILSPEGVPDNIRNQLSTTLSFLFIGFDFERWYTQLLLQLLTFDRPGRPKFAINTVVADSAARNFLIKQFKLKFINGQPDFFARLRARLAERNLLRHFGEKRQSPRDREKLSEDIAEDRLETVIDELMQLSLGTPLQDRALALRGRLENWNRNHELGLVSAADETVERNNVRLAIIQLFNDLL